MLHKAESEMLFCFGVVTAKMTFYTAHDDLIRSYY